MELPSPKDLWQYDHCKNAQLTDQQIAAYRSKGKLAEDISYFYSLISSAIHPAIIKSNILTVNEDNVPVPSNMEISFKSIMIDYCTIQIMFSFLPRTKIVQLTFQSNAFEEKNLELLFKCLISKPNNVYSLNFTWNDYMLINQKRIPFCTDNLNANINIEEAEMEILKKSQDILTNIFLNGNKLEAINFRGNLLGDELVSKIFHNLQSNTSLKVLNLFKNNLTNQCKDALCNMALFNRKLQDINLGGNNIGNETIEQLKDYLGSYKLTEEEVNEHNTQVKARDDIISQNKKNKGGKKPIIEVPFVDEMQLIEDVYYKIRNNTLRKIDIMGNKEINQKSFDSILYILEHNLDLIMVLDLYNYEKESLRELMKPDSKYCNQVYLTN